MAVDIQFTNDARSTLASALSAIATALTVKTGEGDLFPSITGSQYFYATLQDTNGNREIIKVTARTGDTFGTIARAQEGTTALAFAQGDKVELRLSAQALESKAQEEIASALLAAPVISDPLFQAWDELQQAAMPTLAYDSEEYLLLTPTAAGVLPLPTTGVKQGRRFVIVNLATDPAYGIRVNASGGNQVTYAPPSTLQPIPVEVMALSDTPTLASHWAVLKPPRGVLYALTADSSLAGPTTVNPYSLPADLLYANGMTVRVEGQVNLGVGVSSIFCQLGANDVPAAAALGSSVGNREGFYEQLITRRTSATQAVGTRYMDAGGFKSAYTAGTEDFTTILALGLREANAITSTIQMFQVELL